MIPKCSNLVHGNGMILGLPIDDMILGSNGQRSRLGFKNILKAIEWPA